MSNDSRKNRRPGVLLHIWPPFIVITISSIALNIILHSHVRNSLVNRYPSDSFYTLSIPAAIGLSVITFTLLVMVLLLAWWTSQNWIKRCAQQSIGRRSICLVLNLGAIATVYLIMLMIAPQVFYTYYQLIFTGLPIQWVIKPLSSEILLKLITLPLGASMADHLAGLTLWVLMFNTAFQWSRCYIDIRR